jgi:Tol biopolymer transport system component
MDDAEISPTAIAEQLERVLQSDVFRAAGRSSKLMRFLVEETINGRAEHLKDYTLGAEVLGRGDGFDPRTDPIARVEASRLRSRLDLYYATEGASDSLLITLPKGGYVPRFGFRSPPTPAATLSHARRRPARIVAAFVALTGLIVSVFWWRGSTAIPPAEVRLDMTTPATTDPVSLAVSPDGDKVVFVASAGGPPRLWLRALQTTTARALAGTEHASLPFWSPDSRSIGFFADSRVKRIDMESGRLEELAGAVVPGGGAWNQDGLIVYAGTVDSELTSASSDGNRRGTVTILKSGQTGHRAPQFLPDGRRFVYYAMGRADVRGVYVGELGGSMSRRLFDADTPAVYVKDHLLYVHQGTLMAQRFSAARLALEGDPAPIAEHVAVGTRANIAALAVSAAGPIAYRTGSPGGKRQFVWFDRNGGEVTRVGSVHGFGPSYASMSPDERRLAVQRTDAGKTDIWLLDVERDAPVRFTTDPEADIAPLWSPRGDRLVFSSRRNRFNLYEKAVGAPTATELLATEEAKSATDWSDDGRFILFRSLGSATGWDIWAMPMSGDRKPFAVARTKFEERDAQFSPDGKWIAYQSDETGRFEIYLQPFQGRGERVRLSTDGGVQALWRADGRELFYLALDGQLNAVPIAWSLSGGAPEAGTPVPLFATRVGSLRDIALHHYIPSADGQRFLLDTLVEEPASPIVLILNWRPLGR